MSEATLKQIAAMGPVNTLKLCRNACVFYRMKEKHEKALEKGELEKADRCMLRKAAALAGIRRAAEKIAAKTRVCKAEEIEDSATNFGEYDRPSFRFEAWTGISSVIIGAIGILASAEKIIEIGIMGVLVTAFIYQRTFLEFVGTVYSVLDKKMRKPGNGELGKAEAAT